MCHYAKYETKHFIPRVLLLDSASQHFIFVIILQTISKTVKTKYFTNI